MFPQQDALLGYDVIIFMTQLYILVCDFLLNAGTDLIQNISGLLVFAVCW